MRLHMLLAPEHRRFGGGTLYLRYVDPARYCSISIAAHITKFYRSIPVCSVQIMWQPSCTSMTTNPGARVVQTDWFPFARLKSGVGLD